MELRFVRDESERLGLSFDRTAVSYAKFIAATKNTAIEGEAARKVFSGVSEAVTALRLTAEQSSLIFLALTQMMSKGRVTSEELSRQLGEHLPGAVRLTAEAMGMTTAQLLDMMEKGDLMSADVLPKLAEQLHRTYGEGAEKAAETGQAAINRFNNALFETKSALGDSIIPLLTTFMELSIPVIKKLEQIKVSSLAYPWIGPIGVRAIQAMGGTEKSTTGQSDYAHSMEQGYAQMFADQASAESARVAKARDEAARAAAEAEEAAKKAAASAFQWKMVLADLHTEVEKGKPGLTEYAKELLDIENRFAYLYAQAEKKKLPTTELPGLKKGLIDNAALRRDIAAADEQSERLNEEWKKQKEAGESAYNALTDYQAGYTAFTKSEYEKRIRLIEEEAAKLKDYAGATSEEIIAIGEAEAAKKAEVLREIFSAEVLHLDDLTRETKSAFDLQTELAKEAARNMQDAFSDFFFDAMTGKLDSLADYVTSFTDALAKTVSNKLAAVLGGVADNWLSGLFTPSLNTSASAYSYAQMDFIGSARGNAFASGLDPYRNSIVTRPTIFGFARGVGLMGEGGGPGEAIMPLTRTPSGDLGVRAEVGGGETYQIIIQCLDTQTALDFVNRNPGPFLAPFMSSLKKAGAVRSAIRDSL